MMPPPAASVIPMPPAFRGRPGPIRSSAENPKEAP